jgi:hypothetical protein
MSDECAGATIELVYGTYLSLLDGDLVRGKHDGEEGEEGGVEGRSNEKVDRRGMPGRDQVLLQHCR